MHDLPYLMSDKIGPEITTSMTRACWACKYAIKNRQEMLYGVQILAGGNQQALAVAQAVGIIFYLKNE